MSQLVAAESPPIRRDEDGALRVGNTRVILDLVVHAFQDGATPEEIILRYSTLTLADAYAAISYYLGHRQEIDAYLAEREKSATVLRREIEARQPDLPELRARIAARHKDR